jgi:hypothetical protein
VGLTSGALNANLHYCTNHLEPNLLASSWKRVERAAEEYCLADNSRLETVGLLEFRGSVMRLFHLADCRLQNSVCPRTTRMEEEADPPPARA